MSSLSGPAFIAWKAYLSTHSWQLVTLQNSEDITAQKEIYALFAQIYVYNVASSFHIIDEV